MSVDTGVLAVRRSPAEIERLVALFGSSGMRRREFCRSHGVAVSTLARHLRKHMQTDGNSIERSRIIAVELSAPARVVASGEPSAALIVLLPNKRRVEVCRGFDQATLVQLLTVLEECGPCSE